MAPAFGLVEAKALLPYFKDAVTKARELCLHPILEANVGPRHQMADKWSAIIENGKSGHSATIDVNLWLGKATLDAYVLALVLGVRGLRINRESVLGRVGAAAFEYDFGALDDTDNPFTRSYENLMYGRLFPLPVVRGSYRANSPSYSPVLPPWGTPLDYSFSSWPSRDGSQG